MKYAILCSFVLGTASAAFAQTAVPPSPAAAGSGSDARANPPLPGNDPADRSGTFQIMLQGPPVVADTVQTERGFGLAQAPGGGGTIGYVGISGAVGYTLSSLFEFGGGLKFGFGGNGNGGSDYDFLVEPFVKLNLGPTFRTGAINPFVMAGVGIGVTGDTGASVDGISGGGSSSGIFDIDIDPGVEWLVGGRWGFDAYIPIQFEVPLAGGNIGLNIGVGYGLVAYL